MLCDLDLLEDEVQVAGRDGETLPGRRGRRLRAPRPDCRHRDGRDLGDKEQHRRERRCPVDCTPPEPVTEVTVISCPTWVRHGGTPHLNTCAPTPPAWPTEGTTPPLLEETPRLR